MLFSDFVEWFGKFNMTKRQAAALAFIEQFWKEHGYAPCYGEIAEAIGVRSKSGVHRIVHSLQEQKRIKLRPGRHRSAVVVDAA